MTTDLIYEIPVATAGTLYLVVYSSGAVVCDVHEMIDRVAQVANGAEDPAVHLILPDGQTIVADVLDVSGNLIVDPPGSGNLVSGPGNGTEWEIVGFRTPSTNPDDAEQLEYINYLTDDRTDYDEHAINIDHFG